MRIAAYTIWGSTIAMGLADFMAAPQAIQHGALAILGLMVWYLLARTLPAQAEAQREDRAAFLVSQEKDRKAYLAAQEASRRDTNTTLAGLASSLDNMAVIISSVRRDS